MKTNTQPMSAFGFGVFIALFFLAVFLIQAFIGPKAPVAPKPELPAFNVEPTTTITAKP